jgi:hypothetical protein
VDLRWLIVVRPADAAEGFALGGALLSGRTVDLLAVDLPARLPVRADDPLRRLAAHARRVGARLLLLEPRSLAGSLQGTLAESTGLRLELERRSWIRLGDDVVGQHTEVTVAKNRYGPPGRHTDLEIHYQVDGERAVAAHAFARQATLDHARSRKNRDDEAQMASFESGQRSIGTRRPARIDRFPILPEAWSAQEPDRLLARQSAPPEVQVEAFRKSSSGIPSMPAPAAS